MPQEIHGHLKDGERHPLYATWAEIRKRCHNPKCKDFPRYGGRGGSLVRKHYLTRGWKEVHPFTPPTL